MLKPSATANPKAKIHTLRRLLISFFVSLPLPLPLPLSLHSGVTFSMKYQSSKKKDSLSKGARKGKRASVNEDPFFSHGGSNNKKRRILEDDAVIDSGDSEEDGDDFFDSRRRGGHSSADEGVDGDAELASETADEKRLKVAKEYVESIKEIARREREEESGGEESDGKGKNSDYASIAAQILEQEQLMQSGRVRRELAASVQRPKPGDEFRLLFKHRKPVTSVALSEDDMRVYSASKDGTIAQCDVDSGKGEKYNWPPEEVLRSHGFKYPQGKVAKHSKHVLGLAVSSDGRYLASGGMDCHVHLWDTRTRLHIQAFPGHRGSVSCLTFRQGTSELFSGSFDRTVKIWNAEDRAYINTLFGHQSEVLTIDCLQKERLLTVGRDRSMQLWKVPEESRLVFRAPVSSLECSCFISNDEYLSGSDDGSIQLWSMLRKKPLYIVKNAHALLAHRKHSEHGNEKTFNDHIENGKYNPNENFCSAADSWIGSVTVCRGSDLAASGAGDGAVRLWAINSESKDIQPLYDLPLAGFVNSLAFAKSGRFIVAACGQEPRLGRWARNSAVRNGVLLHPLDVSQDGDRAIQRSSILSI